ncbi:hypothetical protein FB45DRAFT_1020335 [Roridomyces roridus]|uniref:Uncharacterized protein n=1 Tax=Roridomyces roridus TaxID=1738132 RepID=A0AAD7CH03_9AGAR|nr:hypothetical protein FB45DRAFT_1042223 [Roridomyces roridus]KAJ7648128.1 hypothetical protein FB45DRAFT_1020335 [Roridomyces roridus]
MDASIYSPYELLRDLYPATFAFVLRLYHPSTMSPSSDAASFVAPASVREEWEEARDEAEHLLGAKNTSSKAFLKAMTRTAECLEPILADSVLFDFACHDGVNGLLSNVVNKMRQCAEKFAQDGNKEPEAPVAVSQFLDRFEVFRLARQKIAGGAGRPAIEAFLKNPFAKPAASKSSSKRRARSPSVDSVSSIDLGEDELKDDSVMDVDKPAVASKGKEKQVPAIEPHATPTATAIVSDSEGEGDSQPSRKKADQLHFKKRSSTPTQPANFRANNKAPSKPPTPASNAHNGPSPLSYEEVQRILESANRIPSQHRGILASNDGILRADCACRTRLAELATRIAMEVRQYDAVFIEYEAVRRTMNDRQLVPVDFTFQSEPSGSAAPLVGGQIPRRTTFMRGGIQVSGAHDSAKSQAMQTRSRNSRN